jgi:DNA-binding IclR family transcriptional regulator
LAEHRRESRRHRTGIDRDRDPSPLRRSTPARLGQRFGLQHRRLGASALAAPIVTQTGVTGSVGAIAPQQRFDDAREAAMADAVVAAASELGRRLGDPVVGLRGLTGGTS